MGESFRSRLTRLAFNFFPAYWGTGAHVTYLAHDWREVRIKLPLSWRTRNYVGTIFGGSIYGSVDPFYMVMLIEILGPDYVVWDKSGSVRFKRPGRTPLFAKFVINEQETESIKAELEQRPSLERSYEVNLTDAEGVVHATVQKTIYIRKKEAHREKET